MPQTQTKPVKPHKPYNRKYDRKKVKALAKMGVKATDIANAVDVDVSTITRYLQKIGIKAKEIQQYKSGKADALALNQLKMATISDMIADAWIEKPEVILSQDVRTQKEVLIAVSGVKTYDNNSERLERGESTENVSVLVGAIEALQARRAGKVTPQDAPESTNADGLE